MSDALCGPSNPLQRFKQESHLDRSLQQDRLTSRHAPAQGFRSLHPSTGLLDPEFEAFQAGLPAPDLPQFQTRPSAAPSWAADFQHMHISAPPTFHQHHLPHAAPSTSNWAQGFTQHVTQTAPRAQTSAQSPQQFQYMARHGMNGFQSNFAPQTFAPSVQSKGKEAVIEQFDDAAFERAFDQASEQSRMDWVFEEDWMQGQPGKDAYQNGASTGNLEDVVEHQRRLSADWEAQIEHMSRPEVLERLEDLPAEDIEQTEQQPQDEDDALAATAKELLEKVEHNQSDKFKNSQFLGLMRKLRDREMKVEGDQMVETSAAASSATTSTHAAASALPLFDNTEQTPHPLASAPVPVPRVDTRPPDYGSEAIPLQEQDHDDMRIDPNDGQAVVDHLNREIGMSHTPPQGPFYGDLRPRQRRDDGARRVSWTPWHLQSINSSPEHAPFTQDLDDEYALLRRAADGSSSSDTE